ncbi:MAG TPA: hypothetical protein VF163_03155, partial [Micromonosporaceae bacterium]
AKVVDFGIAAVTHAGPDPVTAGTPAYLAPEVLAGAPAGPAADSYALGALLQAAFTGTAPLRAETFEQARQAHDGQRAAGAGVDLPAEVPAAVVEVVRRSLARDPALRPASAEIAEVLHRAVDRAPVGSGRPTGVASVRPAPRHTPTMIDTRIGPELAAGGGASGIAATGAGPALDPASGGSAGTVGIAAPPALVRRRSPMVALALAVLTALVGLSLLGAALLSGQDPAGPAVAGGSSAPAITATPRPTGPTTAAAALDAIEAEIAAALVNGTIDDDTAHKLVDDIAGLRERLDRGRFKDLDRRVESVRERLADRVDDGDLDQGLATRIDALLADFGQLAAQNGNED